MELLIHRAPRWVGLALLWLLGSFVTCQAATAHLVVRPWSASVAHVLAGNISRAEYFVDADPGLGNGTAIPLTPGADVSGLTFTVNLSTLAMGFHRLSTRTQDVSGVWSLTNTKSFYYQGATGTTPPLANITKAEYFIDAEPGLGNGVNIPVATPGTDVGGLTFMVDLTALTAGFHRLSTRTRDTNNVWSLTNTKSFYYQPASAIPGPPANITRVEYYFDSDPGFGSGTTVPVATPVPDVANVGYVIDLSTLTNGAHRLFVRSRDANGKWSLVSNSAFTKSGCASAPNYAAGLPAVNYLGATTNGTLSNSSASVAFNTDPTAPTTNNSPYYLGTGTLQADLGTAQTISEVRLRLTGLSDNSVTITTQAAATTAGPFTTIDTYVALLVANTPLLVARPLATPASARVLRFQLQNANTGFYVVVSGAGIFNFNCLTPSITTVAPTSGPVGTGVTITGAHLQGTSALTFTGASNNTVTKGFVVSADGAQITGVVVPGGATTGNVTATTPNGTSNGVNFTVTTTPSLVSIAPSSGVVGSPVTLNGANLTGATVIIFAGTANNTVTTGYAVNAAGTQITGVLVPSGATTGNVSVTTPGGTTNGVLFTVTLPAPVLSNLNPTNGPVGTSVKISGTNLSGATGVSFNGTAQTIIGSNTATSLVVAVPVGATTGTVIVTTINGTSNGINFTVTTTPSLASIAPPSGTAGSTVVLNGANLIGATAITFTGTANNTVTAGYSVNAAGTQITGIVAPSGTTTGNVTVTTPGGTSNGVLFTVTLLAPVLSSLSPTTGPVGTSVTISGTNLSGATSVSFNGTNQTTIGNNTTTGVIVAVPAGATTGNVTITTGNGTSNGISFTVTTSGPAISSFSPTFTKSGQVVTVTGANLTGATALTFSGVSQPTFTVNAAGTQLTATVPYANMMSSSDLTSGVITVTTPGGTATSATTLRLLAVTAATVPVGASTYPGGLAGDNVTISGTGFGGATVTYVLNSITYPVTSTVVSETQISATVPDLSGSTAPGGSGGFMVTNTPGLSGANFEVLSPVISSLSPSNGAAGTVVTITGFNFQRNDPRSGTSVPTAITGLTFGGVAGTSFQLLSPTQARATVPASVATSFVRTSGGTLEEFSSRGLLFTVSVPDLVVSTGTQLSPTPIPAGSYNSITVTSTGNGVLSGDVNVAAALTVQGSGGLSDGCSVISGAGSFTLAAGGTLNVCNAQGISSSGAAGAVQVTGTRSFSSGASYGYTGAAATTGSGLPATVLNLAINTAGNVTLTAPVAVTRTVNVGGAGNLVLNGQTLTLLSSAAGTALVVNSGSGVVSGTATVQRYIDPSLNAGTGYRHFSAPVSNTTVAGLATAGFAPEVSQAAMYNASAMPGTTTPFPTVFGYDQSRVTLTNVYAPFDRGFVVPASLAAPLVVGQGYAVNIPAAQLVNFVGSLTNGDQTLALARVAGSGDAGWQLLGNPYPAPLDYSKVVDGVDRTNLDAAMYVYSSTAQYAGTYRSYANGVGGNPVLPVAQGFFVRVSAGRTSGSLTFRNAQRLTAPDATAYQRGPADPRPLVQLELRGATGPADVFYAYAQAGATPTFDPQFDAEKLANPTGLNLSSTASSGQRLAIDGRSVFDATTVLPLNVGVPTAGSYTFAAVALDNLPAGLDAYLNDAQTGQTVNLRTQPAYAFNVTVAQATALLVGRFALHFTASVLATATALTAAQIELYPNPAHARFAVLMPGVSGVAAVQAELVNILGQVVCRQSAALPASGATLTVKTTELAQGVYLLRLQAGAAMVTKRVVIQ